MSLLSSLANGQAVTLPPGFCILVLGHLSTKRERRAEGAEALESSRTAPPEAEPSAATIYAQMVTRQEVIWHRSSGEYARWEVGRATALVPSPFFFFSFFHKEIHLGRLHN